MLLKAYQIKLYQSLEAAAKRINILIIISRVSRPYCGKTSGLYTTTSIKNSAKTYLNHECA